MLQPKRLYYIAETSEELLPGMTKEFPYLLSVVDLQQYPEQGAPWHWHKPVEIFYMEEGSLVYDTPGGQWVFPEGSAGFLSGDVLHRSHVLATGAHGRCLQKLHFFDPSFLIGEPGSRIHQHYFLPILSDPSLEMMALSEENAPEAVRLIRESFELSESEPGYEIKLRNQLSLIWLELTSAAKVARHTDIDPSRMKRMMRYVQEHYPEKISIKDIAASSLISERECYRMFKEHLKCTPVDYLISIRLEQAERLLKTTDESISWICQQCGFGSSSYFGKRFLERYGTPPRDWRRSWQDKENI